MLEEIFSSEQLSQEEANIGGGRPSLCFTFNLKVSTL